MEQIREISILKSGTEFKEAIIYYKGPNGCEFYYANHAKSGQMLMTCEEWGYWEIIQLNKNGNDTLGLDNSNNGVLIKIDSSEDLPDWLPKIPGDVMIRRINIDKFNSDGKVQSTE